MTKVEWQLTEAVLGRKATHSSQLNQRRACVLPAPLMQAGGMAASGDCYGRLVCFSGHVLRETELCWRCPHPPSWINIESFQETVSVLHLFSSPLPQTSYPPLLYCARLGPYCCSSVNVPPVITTVQKSHLQS